MTGHDDDDWDDDFRPAPHPDDRLWRHPSEMFAQAAADAAAASAAADAAATASSPTLKVPTLLPPPLQAQHPRRRLFALAAVSALLVGTTALLATTLTRTETASSDAVTPPASQTASASGVQKIAAGPASNGQVAQSASTERSRQLHAKLSASLPRIQVVTEAGISEGSGFFLTPSGHIATSARLLRNAEYVVVWTHGNRRFPANISGSDMFSDVALLKIEGDDWPPAEVAEDAALRSGQSIYSIDHKHDLMATGQVFEPFGTIRPSNQPSAPRVLISDSLLAGSAIVDDAGAIVAMSTGLTSGESEGSIATPSWLIQRVALDMLISGNSSHAWLGTEIAAQGPANQVVITEIQPHSPAERHGLRVGDEIQRIDSVDIASVETIMRALYSYNPGDDIDLVIGRGESRHVITVTLGSLFD